MSTLNQLAAKHGTDKGLKGHQYTRVYQELLQGQEDKPLDILEIGVYRGASIRMWREYLPNSRITACDNSEERLECIQGIQGVNPVLLDQSDPEALKALAETHGPWDLIIDDGSHKASHQVISWENLREHVKPGGFYVVEDTHVQDPAESEKYSAYQDTPWNILTILKIDGRKHILHTSGKTKTNFPALVVIPF